jgi:hypothetical protein
MAGILLFGGAPGAERAQAADCSNLDLFTYSAGLLTVRKAPPCGDKDEGFRIYCSSGRAIIQYTFLPNDPTGPIDTGVGCNAISSVDLHGGLGNDQLDLSAVSPAGGFPGIVRNSPDGGPGADILMIRNGVPDYADCGPDTDSVLADQPALDSIFNCEIVDSLAPPAAAAAKVNCKKKKTRAKRRKCRKRNAAARF